MLHLFCKLLQNSVVMDNALPCIVLLVVFLYNLFNIYKLQKKTRIE